MGFLYTLHQSDRFSDYEGQWDWDEFYDVARKVAELMGTVDHTVDIIADFRNSPNLPIGSSLTHARNVMKLFPDNWGIMVIVSDSHFINTLVNAFRRIFRGGTGKKTFAVETIEEAYEIIGSRT